MKSLFARTVDAMTGDRSDLADRLIAVGLLIWALPDVPWWWRPPGHSRPTPIVLGLLALALAQSLPFLWRRRAPLVVLALAGASLAIKAGAGLQVTSAEAAVLVAAYGSGNYGSPSLRTATRVGAALSLVVAVVLVLVHPGYHRYVAVFPALLAAALGVGEAANARRHAVANEIRHAQDAERARIARELHDVIAHQLSAIAVQAGAARVAGPAHPDAAVEAVGTIESSARDALIELNHLVGMLRRDPDDRLDRSPQPSVANVPDLVERARRVGLPVALSCRGMERPVPAVIDLAAYRIVQEGLTNAIRYAKGAPTRVDICYGTGVLTVSVEDDGPGTELGATPNGGRGLVGLRERVQLLHGSLDTGTVPGGGFRLVARIPVTQR